MSFVPSDALLKSPASYNAPIASTGSFLSGILGAANPALGILGALAGGPDAALQPDVNTIDGRQQLGIQFGSAFQVGGEGNTLDNSPRLDASPIDTTTTAPAAGGPASLDKNTLVILGALILAALVFLFGSPRR